MFNLLSLLFYQLFLVITLMFFRGEFRFRFRAHLFVFLVTILHLNNYRFIMILFYYTHMSFCSLSLIIRFLNK